MIVVKKAITLTTVFYPSGKAVYDAHAMLNGGLFDIDRSTIITKFGRMITVQKLLKVRSQFRPVIINTEAHAVR
jgi:hypothetical protein